MNIVAVRVNETIEDRKIRLRDVEQDCTYWHRQGEKCSHDVLDLHRWRWWPSSIWEEKHPSLRPLITWTVAVLLIGIIIGFALSVEVGNVRPSSSTDVWDRPVAIRSGPVTTSTVGATADGYETLAVALPPASGAHWSEPLPVEQSPSLASGFDSLPTHRPSLTARSQGEIERVIADAASEFGADAALMLRIGRCESGLRPDAVNKTSGAGGVFQWLDWVWVPNAKALGYGPADRMDATANARVTARAVALGELWRWSASAKCWS